MNYDIYKVHSKFVSDTGLCTDGTDFEFPTLPLYVGCSFIYRVSQKKGGLVFWAQFWGLNGLKSKSGREQTPIKI